MRKRKGVKVNHRVLCKCGHEESSHRDSWCERLDAYTSCRCGKYEKDNLGFLEKAYADAKRSK